MEVLLFSNKGKIRHTILKRKFPLAITVFCFLSSIILSSCSSVELFTVEKSQKRINQTNYNNETISLFHFLNTLYRDATASENKTAVYRLLTNASSNNGSNLQPNAAVNQNLTEMFCQISNEIEQSSSNNALEHQIKIILQRFDEQNDQFILDEYKEAHLDRKIALTASKIIKSFFNQRYCPIVKAVISKEEKMEQNEVHGPISHLNSQIARLLAKIKQMIQSKASPLLLSMIRNFVHSLQNEALNAIKDLHALEKSIGKEHIRSKNDLFNIRKNILISLVNLFFNKTIILEASNGNVQLTNITASTCLNGKHNDHFGSKAEFEVSCAFGFLFNSSEMLKSLIVQNFEYEEKKVVSIGHDKEPKSDKITGNIHSSVHGCSHERSEQSNSVQEAACHLIKELSKDMCRISENNYDHECLKKCIILRFPDMRFQNKLKMGLLTGDYHGLLIALTSFCHGQSAFVTFSLLDLGVYLQKVFPRKEPIRPKCNDQLTKRTTSFLTTKPNMANTVTAKPTANVNKIKINSFSSVTQTIALTTQQTETQAQTIAENSFRQQFIIKSIVGYFLRATEQRLNCNVKFTE